MRRPRRRRPGPAVALLVVAILAPACAIPRPAGDARSLRAAREDETLRQRLPRYDGPVVSEYLARVGDRLVVDAERATDGAEFTVHVVRDPTLNAFAMPSGSIYVHTGLLSRLENEAQLAAIVAREMTRVSRRQALRRGVGGAQPLTTETVAGLAAASRAGGVGEAILSPTASTILGQQLRIAHEAAMIGYGPAMEREADAGALERLVKAGYDPKEALKAFARLKRDARNGGVLERFFYGSEASLGERVASIGHLLATDYVVAAALPDTVKDSDEFGPHMRAVVRENAQLDIRAGRFELAQEQLDRVLAADVNDAGAHLYYGDLHRLQAQRARSVADRDERLRKALASYERSAALDPGAAEVFRQLGLLYYQQRQNEKAREAFRRYVTFRPDAADAARVNEYLVELDR